MNQQQAFQMIAGLCSQLKLNLEEHKQVQQALELLRPVEEKKE
jgi:hypothetical protein